MMKILTLLAVLCLTPADDNRNILYEGTVHSVTRDSFYLKCANGNIESFPVEKRTRYYLDGQQVRFAELRKGQHVTAVWKGSAGEGYTVEVRIKTR